MKKRKYTIKILLLIILITLGVFMFVYAEYDDSPGGQLIGMIVSIVGVMGIIKTNKKTSPQKN
jgi:hypothetical protein